MNQNETRRPPPPPEETPEESPTGRPSKVSLKSNLGGPPTMAKPFSPLTVGKRPCFDCNYILSPYQEFCPNCGAFLFQEKLPALGLDNRTIAAFIHQQRQRTMTAATFEAAGFFLVPLLVCLLFLFAPWGLALTKLLLSPVLGGFLFYAGRRLAMFFLFFKWMPYIQANRSRSTFGILETQIKHRMAEIEKKLIELENLRERTTGFSNQEGQSTVQATLDSATAGLREKHKEFHAQWWNLQLFLWFNRITGIGVKGNQDGLKNDVERVEELAYLGHHYMNQLKKDAQLTPEKSEMLRGRVQEGLTLLKKIQEVVVAQEAEKLVKQVKPIDGGMPEELTVEGRISSLCSNAAQVSLESFTDVIERLDQEYSRLSVERKIARDTKNLLRE